jgi:hypothetical protein
MRQWISILFSAFTCHLLLAQPEFAAARIPDSLKANANAVVRLDETTINITSRNAMTIKRYRVVTVLNEYGNDAVNAMEYENVRDIGATVYNASGQEIKKIKRKDFRETAVSEGFSITDNKVLYLEYTPIQYPYTIVYQSETSSANTAFIPSWYPVSDFLVSAEKSVVSVQCAAGLGFKYKPYNFDGRKIQTQEIPNGVLMSMENLPAFRREAYSPSLGKLIPYVRFGIQKFNLEGVDGSADSWQGFGLWNYRDLLSGTDNLAPETVSAIRALVKDEPDAIAKARRIYQFVQDKTRYVSIQLGIGGWRPMEAADVDRLGYGDCKALTNYTRALLKAVDVPSYYAILYGDENKRDMDSDFVSMQGNHVVLAIPNDGKLTWLECTSQTMPFGFQGNFTDDRMALVVKPEGGELVRTSVYKDRDNSQKTVGKMALDASGLLKGSVEISSKGTQYSDRMALASMPEAECAGHYRQRFSINNLSLKKSERTNSRERVEFSERLEVGADAYASLSGTRMLFAANAFNKFVSVPQRYRTRTNPLVISRGFYDEDEIDIELPENFAIEARPNPVTLSDAYGEYKMECIAVDGRHLRYKRSLLLKSGEWPASDYEKFRKFMEQVAVSDNAKVVLIKQ